MERRRSAAVAHRLVRPPLADDLNLARLQADERIGGGAGVSGVEEVFQQRGHPAWVWREEEVRREEEENSVPLASTGGGGRRAAAGGIAALTVLTTSSSRHAATTTTTAALSARLTASSRRIYTG